MARRIRKTNRLNSNRLNSKRLNSKRLNSKRLNSKRLNSKRLNSKRRNTKRKNTKRRNTNSRKYKQKYRGGVDMISLGEHKVPEQVSVPEIVIGKGKPIQLYSYNGGVVESILTYKGVVIVNNNVYIHGGKDYYLVKDPYDERFAITNGGGYNVGYALKSVVDRYKNPK